MSPADCTKYLYVRANYQLDDPCWDGGAVLTGGTND